MVNSRRAGLLHPRGYKGGALQKRPYGGCILPPRFVPPLHVPSAEDTEHSSSRQTLPRTVHPSRSPSAARDTIGLRPSEASGLRVQDLDLADVDRGRLYVRRST